MSLGTSAPHTPGPWMWDSDPIKGDPLNRVRYRVVARGKTVTQCYYSNSDAQAEPDARLIAAAPDLLTACRETRIRLLGLAGMERWVDMLSDAIEQATGSRS